MKLKITVTTQQVWLTHSWIDRHRIDLGMTQWIPYWQNLNSIEVLQLILRKWVVYLSNRIDILGILDIKGKPVWVKVPQLKIPIVAYCRSNRAEWKYSGVRLWVKDFVRAWKVTKTFLTPNILPGPIKPHTIDAVLKMFDLFPAHYNFQKKMWG